MADLQLKIDWVVIQNRDVTERPWTRKVHVLPKIIAVCMLGMPQQLGTWLR